MFSGILVMGLSMLIGVSAYAGSDLMVKMDRTIAPKPDQALIIFMRKASIGAAISSSIFDVTTNETKLIGVFKNKVKCCYDVAPGEHLFMVVGESADFLKATVKAGKTYYVRVTPRMGFNKARFSLKPFRQSELGGDDFVQMDSGTELKEITPAGEEWARKNAPDIEQKRIRYWEAWGKLSPELQDSMTLYAEDGR